MHVPVTWDPLKAASNLRKHGVTFEEALSALHDAHAASLQDVSHSAREERFIHLGMSDRRRLVVVIYAEYGDTLRIISARVATTTERHAYEEG